MGEKINSSASEIFVIAIWRLQRAIIDMRFLHIHVRTSKKSISKAYIFIKKSYICVAIIFYISYAFFVKLCRSSASYCTNSYREV